MRTVKNLLLVAFFTLTGMCAALVAVNLIPNDRLLLHVQSSMSPTNYQQSQLGPSRVDFWDECIAATVGLGHGADRLSLVRRSFLSPVIGNCEEFQKYKRGEVWTPFNAVSEPAAAALPTNLGFNYWRYWHGYQILSRPLLYRFSLYGLHEVLFALFLLSGIFFATQVSRFSSSCSWSLVIALFCVPLIDQVGIISHSMVWIIAFCIGGWLLLPSTSSDREQRDPFAWFLVTGMLCCFFDLFTVPLVTLTIPLLGLYWRGKYGAGGPKLTVRRIITLSAVWLTGYSLCWTTKWAIVAAISGPGIFNELSTVVQHRIGTGGGPMGDGGQQLSVTAVRSVLINAKACWYGWLIAGGVAVARIRPLAASLLSNKTWRFSAVLVPLVLFGMPMVWLAVVKQHSIWHAWFVGRIYFTSFALVLSWILAARRETASKRVG